jgi:Uncharacterized conserved protein
VSISISLGRRKGQGVTGRTYLQIITRAAPIYLLGAAVSIIPFFQFQATDAPDPLKMLVWLVFAAALFFLLLRNYTVAGVLAAVGILGIITFNLGGYNVVAYNFATWRIAGVLQRISVCYLFASLIFLHMTWRQQLVLSVCLLLVYWALMTLVTVPGCEITSMNDKACNLAAYVDRMIITEPHMWRVAKVYDPEGILSTTPAIVTTISGILTGLWLRARPAREIEPGEVEPAAVEISDNEFRLGKVAGMFFFGVVLLALGLIWHSYFPMNKSLWTSSYVLATTGLALLILGACYWLIDVKGYAKWAGLSASSVRTPSHYSFSPVCLHG